MSGGTKNDQGKPPIGLIPQDALIAISEVLGFGKEKYSAWNWSKGFKYSRLIDATYRHLGAWKEGEDRDPESNLSHIAHAACCLMFLITHERRKLGEDDRHHWNSD